MIEKEKLRKVKKVSTIKGKDVVRINASDTRPVELASIVGRLTLGYNANRARRFGYSSIVGTLSSVSCLGSYSSIQPYTEYYDGLDWTTIPNKRKLIGELDVDAERNGKVEIAEQVYLCGRLWSDFASLFQQTQMNEFWKAYVMRNLSAGGSERRQFKIGDAGVEVESRKRTVATIREFWNLFDSRRLEWLIVPLDGSNDLRPGNSGVASVVAGAPTNTFIPFFESPKYIYTSKTERSSKSNPVSKDDHWWPGFFVFTGNQECSKRFRSIFQAPENSSLEGAASDPLDSDALEAKSSIKFDCRGSNTKTIRERTDLMAIMSVLGFIADLQENNRPLSIGVKSKPHGVRPEVWREILQGCCQIAKFGSPIAGAVTSQLGKLGIDAFFSLVDPVQATIIAACSYATDSVSVFLPIRYRKKENQLSVVELLEEPNDDRFEVYSQARLVRPRDLFVNIAGVTDSSLLHGVRFRGTGTVETQVLSLRHYSRSKRFVTNRHDIRPEIHRRYAMNVDAFNPVVPHEKFGRISESSLYLPQVQHFDMSELSEYIKAMPTGEDLSQDFLKKLSAELEP